jgi:excisionase family DNA binding protein
MTQQTEQKPTIGLRDIANRIGVNYETARRWAGLGRLPVFKFNGVGHWRAYVSDIDEYIEKHKNKAAAWSGS